MRVIDKTPFQADNGETNLLQRLQGVLRYGSSWGAELEAQKQIILQLSGVLEEGFTLIRNLTLAGSRIIEPLILIGPAGIIVMRVTRLRGFYQAKGDQWNEIKDGIAIPASVNLLGRVTRLARAVQLFLERQGVVLPRPVEPILIASGPAINIVSLRPIARVVLSDAVRQFGVSLQQARPVLSSELVHEVVDHLVNPRPEGALSEPRPQAVTDEAPAPETPASETPTPQSRARAIFRAAEEAKPFDPSDVTFALEEDSQAGAPGNFREPSATQPVRHRRPAGALRPGQRIVLGVMLLLECIILGGFAYLIFTAGR